MTLQNYIYKFHSYVPEDFVQDSFNFFLRGIEGCMEKWEYGASHYRGDPAGGAEFWADVIANPGSYYPAHYEPELVQLVTQSELKKEFIDIKTFLEFGPGSEGAIKRKTIPFVSMSRDIELYVAIDESNEQATLACSTISRNLNIPTKAIHGDFTKGTFKRTWEGPAAYMMWGCTIGNLPGQINQNPFDGLVREVDELQKTLNCGDFLILIFDTNEDERSILQAYNEPDLKRQSLSWLHALKRDGIATGDFDPRVWVHEPVWYPDVMQCAHTIFPMFDQTITIAGHTVHIPAWRRFVSNNSYKFKPSVMIAAAEAAGLSTEIFQHGPMAMLIAKKA